MRMTRLPVRAQPKGSCLILETDCGDGTRLGEEEFDEDLRDGWLEDAAFCSRGGLDAEGMLFGSGGTDAASAAFDPIDPSSAAGRPGSSSGDCPPPPRPAVGLSGRTANPAAHVLYVEGGKVTYYETAARSFFVAECSNKKHGRCVRTKTAIGYMADIPRSRKGQGRPLGYLCAWLRKGPSLGSKAKHWEAGEEPTRAERIAARNKLKGLVSADAAGLLAAEWPRTADSDSEPEVVP